MANDLFITCQIGGHIDNLSKRPEKMQLYKLFEKSASDLIRKA